MWRQRLIGTIALALLAGVPAFAGDLSSGGENPKSWWNNFWTDWHRNNAWPEPFIYPDRASVCNFNNAQIAKGWQMQNLLGDPHFNAEGTRLSPAGLTKLRTILTQNPVQYRNVFVQRNISEEVTGRRLAATQQVAAEIAHGPMPDVVVSDQTLNSTPAENVYSSSVWLNTYMQGMPKPKPLAFQDDAGGGGSGGGSGN